MSVKSSWWNYFYNTSSISYVWIVLAAVLSHIFLNLLNKLDWDFGRAERAIIFIDEIDKLASVKHQAQRDIGGMGVQQALLTALESTVSLRMTVIWKLKFRVTCILFYVSHSWTDSTTISVKLRAKQFYVVSWQVAGVTCIDYIKRFWNLTNKWCPHSAPIIFSSFALAHFQVLVKPRELQYLTSC